MLSFNLQICPKHPPSGAAADSKKVQFSLDEAPQPIVTRIQNHPKNVKTKFLLRVTHFSCQPVGGGCACWCDIASWLLK